MHIIVYLIYSVHIIYEDLILQQQISILKMNKPTPDWLIFLDVHQNNTK